MQQLPRRQRMCRQTRLAQRTRSLTRGPLENSVIAHGMGGGSGRSRSQTHVRRFSRTSHSATGCSRPTWGTRPTVRWSPRHDLESDHVCEARAEAAPGALGLHLEAVREAKGARYIHASDRTGHRLAHGVASERVRNDGREVGRPGGPCRSPSANCCRTHGWTLPLCPDAPGRARSTRMQTTHRSTVSASTTSSTPSTASRSREFFPLCRFRSRPRHTRPSRHAGSVGDPRALAPGALERSDRRDPHRQPA